MKLDEEESIEELDNQSQTETYANWHPGMGDYEKNNSEVDSEIIRKKIFKSNIIITILIILQLGILAFTIFYFLN